MKYRGIEGVYYTLKRADGRDGAANFASVSVFEHATDVIQLTVIEEFNDVVRHANLSVSKGEARRMARVLLELVDD